MVKDDNLTEFEEEEESSKKRKKKTDNLYIGNLRLSTSRRYQLRQRYQHEEVPT